MHGRLVVEFLKVLADHVARCEPRALEVDAAGECPRQEPTSEGAVADKGHAIFAELRQGVFSIFRQSGLYCT